MTGRVPASTVVLVASAGAMLGCAADVDPLCESVDRVVEIHAEIPRPDPVAIADRYRDLATAYGDTAEALGDEPAAESTAELSASFDRAADLLDEHADADRERLDELFDEADVLVALEERMEAGEALGFTSRAWAEIDSRCEVPIDPTAP